MAAELLVDGLVQCLNSAHHDICKKAFEAGVAASSPARVVNLVGPAQVSLAITMAYLGLNRFRYRDEIRKHATGVFVAHKDAEGAPQASTAFLTLRAFSGLGGDCDDDRNALEKAHRKEVWFQTNVGRTYRKIFANTADRKIIGAISAITAIFLFLLTVASFGWGGWVLQGLNSDGCIAGMTVFLAIGCILPVIGVYLGGLVVDSAKARADQCAQEITEMIAVQAQNAAKPNVGQISRVNSVQATAAARAVVAGVRTAIF